MKHVKKFGKVNEEVDDEMELKNISESTWTMRSEIRRLSRRDDEIGTLAKYCLELTKEIPGPNSSDYTANDIR